MKKIIIDGIIGWETNSGNIRRLLDEANGDELSVEISSPGGFVFDGLTIFNLIRDYSRNINKVTTKIIGLAASMASYIALAGNKVIAEDNSVFMIHNVQAIVMGDYRDMKKEADQAERLTDLLAMAYSKKSGKPKKEIRQMMNDSTFFYGKESVDAGFVDEIIKTEKQSDKSTSIGLAQDQVKDCFAQMKESKKAKNDIGKVASIYPDIFNLNSENENEIEILENSQPVKKTIEEPKITMEVKKIMTKEELKAQNPELYNEIFNLGAKIVQDKLDNFKAHLEFSDIAPKEVMESLKKEEIFSPTIHAAKYAKIQIMNEMKINRLEDDNNIPKFKVLQGGNGENDKADTDKYTAELKRKRGIK